MLKLIGGMFIGAFVGGMVLEILRRERPDVVVNIRKRAKDMSDSLFENIRESYDFRKIEN